MELNGAGANSNLGAGTEQSARRWTLLYWRFHQSRHFPERSRWALHPHRARDGGGGGGGGRNRADHQGWDWVAICRACRHQRIRPAPFVMAGHTWVAAGEAARAVSLSRNARP